MAQRNQGQPGGVGLGRYGTARSRFRGLPKGAGEQAGTKGKAWNGSFKPSTMRDAAWILAHGKPALFQWKPAQNQRVSVSIKRSRRWSP